MPIAVSLDLHANVTESMVRNCDVIAGYKTYPHVDQYESGHLAGSILLRALKGEVKPVMAWGNVPLLAQTLRQNTAETPDEGLRGRRPCGRAAAACSLPPRSADSSRRTSTMRD